MAAHTLGSAPRPRPKKGGWEGIHHLASGRYPVRMTSSRDPLQKKNAHPGFGLPGWAFLLIGSAECYRIPTTVPLRIALKRSIASVDRNHPPFFCGAWKTTVRLSEPDASYPTNDHGRSGV